MQIYRYTVFQNGWSHWHNNWRNPKEVASVGYPKVAKMDQILRFSTAMSPAKRVSEAFFWKKKGYFKRIFHGEILL